MVRATIIRLLNHGELVFRSDCCKAPILMSAHEQGEEPMYLCTSCEREIEDEEEELDDLTIDFGE